MFFKGGNEKYHGGRSKRGDGNDQETDKIRTQFVKKITSHYGTGGAGEHDQRGHRTLNFSHGGSPEVFSLHGRHQGNEA